MLLELLISPHPQSKLQMHGVRSYKQESRDKLTKWFWHVQTVVATVRS